MNDRGDGVAVSDCVTNDWEGLLAETFAVIIRDTICIMHDIARHVSDALLTQISSSIFFRSASTILLYKDGNAFVNFKLLSVDPAITFLFDSLFNCPGDSLAVVSSLSFFLPFPLTTTLW